MSRPPRAIDGAVNSAPGLVIKQTNLISKTARQGRFWLNLLIWAGLILGLAPHLLDFWQHSLSVMAWKWQVDYDEGINLSAAWHLSQGHNIYANNPPDQFIAAAYPFLYYVLNAIPIKLFGVNMLSGRLISFVASLLIGLLIGFSIFMIGRRNNFSRLNGTGAGVFAGLIWFCLPPTFIWSTFYKQDMLAIALALAGLTVVYLWPDDSRLYWSAPIFSLAFAAKQNMLSAALIAGLYIAGRELLQKDKANRRRVISYTLNLLGWVIIPFLVLTLLTKGGYYNHNIDYQANFWNYDDFARRVGRLVKDHPILIGLGFLGFGQLLWSKKAAGSGNWFYPLYMIVALLSLFTIGTYQGNNNHLLILLPPLLILVGSGLAWLIQIALTGPIKANVSFDAKFRVPGFVPLLLTLGLLPLILWQILNFGDPATYFSFGSLPNPERRGLMERLEKDIRETPGDFVSEDLYLPLSQNRAVPYDTLYTMRFQAEAGKWDERVFLQDLRDRRFGLILLDHNSRRWSKTSWQVFNENYELVFPEGIDLWRPRPRPLVPQNNLNNCSLTLGSERMQFIGSSFGPKASQTLKAGSGLTLTTYWKIDSPLQSNYILFAHVVDKNGKLLAQRDAQPDRLDLNVKPGELPPVAPAPTSGWRVADGTLIIDQSLPLPADLPPGEYTLIVGAYKTGSGGLENMQPACANAYGAAINLGQIKLQS